MEIDCNIGYYVVRYTNDRYRDTYRFEEASGEQYCYWLDEEILGWLPIEELDNIPILSKEN